MKIGVVIAILVLTVLYLVLPICGVITWKEAGIYFIAGLISGGIAEYMVKKYYKKKEDKEKGLNERNK